MTHYAFTADPTEAHIPFGPNHIAHVARKGYVKSADVVAAYHKINSNPKAKEGDKKGVKGEWDMYVLGKGDKTFESFVAEYPGKIADFGKEGFFPAGEKLAAGWGKELAAINTTLIDSIKEYAKSGKDSLDKAELEKAWGSYKKIRDAVRKYAESALPPAALPVEFPEKFVVGKKTGVKNIDEVLPDYAKVLDKEKDIKKFIDTFVEKIYGAKKEPDYKDLLRRFACGLAIAEAKDKKAPIKAMLEGAVRLMLIDYCPAIITVRGSVEGMAKMVNTLRLIANDLEDVKKLPA